MLVCFLHVFQADFHGINLKGKKKMLERKTIQLVFLPFGRKYHRLHHLRTYCGFSVFKGLDCVVSLFHVERLLHEVVSLALVPERENHYIKSHFHSR